MVVLKEPELDITSQVCQQSHNYRVDVIAQRDAASLAYSSF